jgi:beta-galactosidase/beta-glucuronidase
MNLASIKTFGLMTLAAVMASLVQSQAEDPTTEFQYLSGHGPKDAVPWDFQISGGRRSGEAATIPVPSNWELHGFGCFTYGQETNRPVERGSYRRKFTVPESWSGRRINLVFNGVMTDATVKVNGISAGPTHIGSFYQFKHEITALLKMGPHAENLLEVEVAKTSSNRESDLAEMGI